VGPPGPRTDAARASRCRPGRYGDAVHRVWATGIGALVSGLVLIGCGSGSSSSTTTAATATTYPGGTAGWLRSAVQPWNQKLDADKNRIVTSVKENTGITTAAYDTRLAKACAQLLGDTGQAAHVPDAPLHGLYLDWQYLVSQTKAYADQCLVLTSDPSTANVTAWTKTLTSMNTAARALNTAVVVALNPNKPATG